jgi:hypothetical protein
MERTRSDHGAPRGPGSKTRVSAPQGKTYIDGSQVIRKAP